jgi:hypothetical protein
MRLPIFVELAEDMSGFKRLGGASGALQILRRVESGVNT